MHIRVLVITGLILIIRDEKCEATVENMESPEVDLLNYRFFRYPTLRPSVEREPPLSIQDGINRAASVVTYFRNTLFGSPWLQLRFNMPFDPEAGKRNSVEYQRKFGYRGEKLVHLLGKGYSPDSVRNLNNINPRFNG